MLQDKEVTDLFERALKIRIQEIKTLREQSEDADKRFQYYLKLIFLDEVLQTYGVKTIYD